MLKKLEKEVKGHIPTCRCNLCKLLLQTRKSTLASELRLNLWIELGWYAEIEKWKPGWEKIAIQELTQKDKWWIVTGQYKPIEFWLEKFNEFGEEIMLDRGFNERNI